MYQIPWSTQINFASALLLHSCFTILIKESLNWLEIARRFILRHQLACSRPRHAIEPKRTLETSAVLDAYTSVFSLDAEGEQAELYFTNTGVALLAISLVSSVAMNVLLTTLALNMIVAGTFGWCFLASLLVGRRHITLPFMALRRAARFIWSDTPFVNFFTLIYIATALRGRTILRLQDYITFRSIAVFELLFMKAKLAASDPKKQESLMRRLLESEWTVLSGGNIDEYSNAQLPVVHGKDITAFTTAQRLCVMLLKTTIGYDRGGLSGLNGPVRGPLPAVGHNILELSRGWKLCRLSEDVMILVDCFPQTDQKNRWSHFLGHAHGALLRRLGKSRVVYLIRSEHTTHGSLQIWHSNANLVTGLTDTWLKTTFERGPIEEDGIFVG